MVNLILQGQDSVKQQLEALINYVRKKQYDLEIDYTDLFGLLFDFTKSMYEDFVEVNKPLREGLKAVCEEARIKPRNIADFCCGFGGNTLKLAEEFPESEVYGFDIIPEFIELAKRRASKKPKVHFKRKDVYRFKSDTNFDLVTFHKACGSLSDKVIQYATSNGIPLVGGRFCCYHNIPIQRPYSKRLLTNLYLKLDKISSQWVKSSEPDFVKPSESIDRDLLSRFLKEDLGITEEEYEKIAAFSVDSKIGTKIIDLNRVMKLIERDYNVVFDEDRHILVARKKP